MKPYLEEMNEREFRCSERLYSIVYSRSLGFIDTNECLFLIIACHSILSFLSLSGYDYVVIVNRRFMGV